MCTNRKKSVQIEKKKSVQIQSLQKPSLQMDKSVQIQ